ncbi:hypothetical protein ACTXJX_11820 [Glutamicibacter ardleyensis]|uniref:hypothetical protein n=1 Tax=Glutamicibacter ardleyensis TaxID=225894 RepID=UPI003FD3D899
MSKRKVMGALANERGEFTPTSVVISSVLGSIILLGAFTIVPTVVPTFQDRATFDEVSAVARGQHGALSATSQYQSASDLEKYRWVPAVPESVATRAGHGGACFTVIGKSTAGHLWVMEQDDDQPREAPGLWMSDCLSKASFEDLARSIGGTVEATGALEAPRISTEGSKVKWTAVPQATKYELTVANERGRTVETLSGTSLDVPGADLPGTRISITPKNDNQNGAIASITVAK